MADISTSTNADVTEVIFTAETAKGLNWLGDQQVPVPVAEAAEFRKSAEAAGLVVKPAL